MKNLVLGLFLILASYAGSQTNPTIISGDVKDLLSEGNLAYAQVRLYRYQTEILPNGLTSIKSFLEADLMEETSSDANGFFELNFGQADQLSYYAVAVAFPGQEPVIKQFIQIQKETNNHLNFHLTPQNPTTAQEQLIEEKTAQFRLEKDMAKFEDVTHNQVLQNTAPSMKNGCTYANVPTQVYVENLVNGYNGSTSGSGFTGMINFDDYVAGVVQGELGGITTNVDVKKAQAVAARTYSMNRHLSGLPVNIGQAYHDTPNATAIQGSQQTTTEIILYNGTVIDAKYSARCNGDYTQHANEGTWAPYSNCNLTGSVVPYLLSRPCSGHPSCGTTSETPCCNVTISTSGVSGYIYGHGVGMCQRGIEQWGEIHGIDYCEMLHKYYTGICIANSQCADSTATLDCSNAVTLNCGQVYSGPASSAASNIDSYACNSWTETGPERVHTFTPSYDGIFNVTISNFTGDLDVYILESCDPDDCVGTVNSSDASLANGVAGHTYYIVVDADDGSGSAYDIVVDCPLLDVDEFDLMNQIEIYPNPSSGIFNLNMGIFVPERIEVYSAIGKVVKIYNQSIDQIDLNSMDSGIYLIRFYGSDSQSVVKKIIKR